MKSDRSDVQDVPQVAGPTTFGPSVLPFLRRRHLQHRRRRRHLHGRQRDAVAPDNSVSFIMSGSLKTM
jgi:hypothetical protein